MTAVDYLLEAAILLDHVEPDVSAGLRAHAARLAQIPPSEVHAAMQDAPHDGRDYRQARAALAYILARINGGPITPGEPKP